MQYDSVMYYRAYDDVWARSEGTGECERLTNYRAHYAAYEACTIGRSIEQCERHASKYGNRILAHSGDALRLIEEWEGRDHRARYPELYR